MDHPPSAAPVPPARTLDDAARGHPVVGVRPQLAIAQPTALGARAAASRDDGMSRHPGRPVREIMTPNVVTFSADTSIEHATKVLLERHISGAPVLDEEGRPVGIVSKTDLLEAWHEYAKEAADDDGETHVVVGDIMVPYLLAAQDTSPISLAAALMAYEGVHRLLVLDQHNAMVGIVSSLDVLRWLAQLSGFCMERGDVPRALAPA